MLLVWLLLGVASFLEPSRWVARLLCVCTGVRRVVGSIVESVARTTVNLEVSLTELDGNIMLWLAPPPSNNLWISFLEPPKLKLTAKPLNMHSVVQYTAMVRPHAANAGTRQSFTGLLRHSVLSTMPLLEPHTLALEHFVTTHVLRCRPSSLQHGWNTS